MMAYRQVRPSPRDIRIVKALAAAVVAAPVAFSLFAVLASGTTGYGARRASLLISEAQAAPTPARSARSIGVNAQDPRFVTHAPRGAALNDAAMLPSIFTPRESATARVAIAARPAPAGALLRVASRGGALIAPRALDGVRLESEGLVVRLAGLEAPAADALCRRLDGVTEPCAARAASRLTVLMHGRVVTCRLSAADGAAEVVGVCKAGKIDLADDLLRAGLARRAEAAPAHAGQTIGTAL